MLKRMKQAGRKTIQTGKIIPAMLIHNSTGKKILVSDIMFDSAQQVSYLERLFNIGIRTGLF